jgi:hypothetical protein
VTEAATATTTEAPAGDVIAATVDRPEWIDSKFWDQDAGQPRVEDLAKSYREVQSLVGRRVSDLSPDARRKLAESLPDEMRSTWEQELRAKLAADDEFITPLIEAKLPKAPDAYDFAAVALPEGFTLDAEHPVLAKAAEFAKAKGMSQEDFSALVAMGAELTAPPPPLEERMAAVGPDYQERGKAVINRALTAAGQDAEARAAVQALLGEVMSPEALRGVELLLAARGEKPAPMDQGTSTPPLSVDALKEIQARPEYRERRDLQEQVRVGYQRLFGETL